MQVFWIVLLSLFVAFSNTIAAVSQPEVDGQWTANVDLKDHTTAFPGTPDRARPEDGWWVTPIHANLLPDGNVLITGWSRKKEKYCEEHSAMGRQNGTTFVLHPSDLEKASSKLLSIQPLNEHPKTKDDVLYCAGHAPLPDGRLLYIGGARYENLDRHNMQEYGLNYARVFSPQTRSLQTIEEPNLAGPHPSTEQLQTTWSWYEQGMMWYPTTTRLPDGKILIVGGLARQTGPFDPTVPNNSISVFDSQAWDQGRSPWSILVPHEVAPRSLDINAFDYAHTFVLPKPISAANGAGYQREVAIFGGLNNTFAFLSLDPKVPASQKLIELSHGHRPSYDGYNANAVSATAALTSGGALMMMGGGDRGRIEGQRLDLYQPLTGQWKSVDTGITRIRPASTLLPDGTVLIMNGEEMWKENDSVGDRRRPTLFDPQTGKVTNLSPWTDDLEDRGYHNVSLLLKDGRVLIGGGRTLEKRADGVEKFRIGCERTDMRIFSPPYLFKGPRPVLQGLRELTALKVGGDAIEFTVNTPIRKKGGVVLMALGASTHHFDQNQRMVPLESVVVSGRVRVKPPSSSLAAPVGNYILFVVSDRGVPSVGTTVQVVQ
jgi:hypothetical protein